MEQGYEKKMTVRDETLDEERLLCSVREIKNDIDIVSELREELQRRMDALEIRIASLERLYDLNADKINVGVAELNRFAFLLSKL